MMGNYFWNMGWGFGFSWIFMILFWGLVIWTIFVLVRSVSRYGCYGSGCSRRDHDHGEHEQKGDHAMNILRERYAKGEISKEEFEKMRKDLGQ